MGFTMSGRRVVALSSVAAALAVTAGLVRKFGVPARVRAVPAQVMNQARSRVRKHRSQH